MSTIICQDCSDHLEEFHKFSQQVAKKQLTLHKEFMDVNLKKEFHLYDSDGWENDDAEDKMYIRTQDNTQKITVTCPIDVFKDESNNDENDEQEMPTEDLLDTSIDNDEKDIIAPDSVAMNDLNSQLSSDGKIDLIKMHRRSIT